MEKWKNGRVEEWKNGRLEDWKIGRMEGWKNWRMRQFDNSTIRQWKNGRMEEWKNWRMRQFDNSTMEGWKDGRMEGWNVEALAEIPLLREKNGIFGHRLLKIENIQFEFNNFLAHCGDSFWIGIANDAQGEVQFYCCISVPSVSPW